MAYEPQLDALLDLLAEALLRDIENEWKESRAASLAADDAAPKGMDDAEITTPER